MTDQPVLGDLRLVKKIAAGGMAEVWEARKVGIEGFEKRVAVKVILPHLNENDDFIRMFLDEGRLAASLDHPNICQILELGEHDGKYYMCMEYIDGVVLSSLMKEASKRGVFIPIEHCCQIIIGACAGLDYAHSCLDMTGQPINLVHRDISPQNIMMTFNGGVKVVDFGIAKAASQVHHTQAGVLKGKYAYMSPEQATGQPLDRRSDIFALGIVLWELTTGHRLFRADNEIATLHKIIGGDYPSPSAYRDAYPPALELIIQKALAPDREKRFQDCGDMQLALEDFLLRHGLPAGSKRLAHYVQRIMSDGDLSDLPDSSALIRATGGFVFEVASNSGVNTPSAAGQTFPPLSPQASYSPPGHLATGSYVGGFSPAPMSPLPGLGTHPVPIEDEISQKYSKSNSSSKGLWIALLVILLLGAIGVGVYAVFQDKTPEVPVFALPWTINSEPRNASIFVNDELRGKTPQTIMFAPRKRYILSIRHDGYLSNVREIQSFTKEMVDKPLFVKLQPVPKILVMGTILVKVKPTQAQVQVDGKPLKELFEGVYEGSFPAGVSHTISVKKEGFEGIDKVFQISLDKKKEVLEISLQRERRAVRRPPRTPARRRPTKVAKVQPQDSSKDDKDDLPQPVLRPKVFNVVPDAWISVQTDPPGAVVRINGSVVGSSPLERYKLTAGKHFLQISKTGFKAVSQQIELGGKEFKEVSVKFKPVPVEEAAAVVSFGGSPSSNVYIDNKFIGKIPIFSKKIESGRRLVEFRTLKYNASFRKHVEFKPGRQVFRHQFPMGQIWLLSRPVAQVYLNGDHVGASMQPPYQVPAGQYKVRFVFPDNRSVTKRVTVEPGEKTRVVARLE